MLRRHPPDELIDPDQIRLIDPIHEIGVINLDEIEPDLPDVPIWDSGGLRTIIRPNRPMLVVKDGEVIAEPLASSSVQVTDAPSLVGAACKILVPNTTIFGSGFLVAPDLVMTNHHVYAPLRNKLGEAKVWFDFDVGSDERHECTIVKAVAFDPVLDYAVLEITNPPVDAPIATLATARPDVGDHVAVVGYPERVLATHGHYNRSAASQVLGAAAGRLRVAPGFVVLEQPGVVLHDCSTTDGSSGSAIVDVQTNEVVAIHMRSIRWGGGYINMARPLQAILDALPADLLEAD